jgi:membrane associated rhomboid family serine protease
MGDITERESADPNVRLRVYKRRCLLLPVVGFAVVQALVVAASLKDMRDVNISAPILVAIGAFLGAIGGLAFGVLFYLLTRGRIRKTG